MGKLRQRACSHTRQTKKSPRSAKKPAAKRPPAKKSAVSSRRSSSVTARKSVRSKSASAAVRKPRQVKPQATIQQQPQLTTPSVSSPLTPAPAYTTVNNNAKVVPAQKRRLSRSPQTSKRRLTSTSTSRRSTSASRARGHQAKKRSSTKLVRRRASPKVKKAVVVKKSPIRTMFDQLKSTLPSGTSVNQSCSLFGSHPGQHTDRLFGDSIDNLSTATTHKAEETGVASDNAAVPPMDSTALDTLDYEDGDDFCDADYRDL